MGRGCFYRCCNAMMVVLNTVSLLASLILLRIWFTTSDADAACDELLLAQFLVNGTILLVVSFLGIVGTGFRIPSFLRFYLVAAFFAVLGLSCFTAYLFVAVWEGDGRGGNPLGDFSGWMQRTVNGGGWESIRRCLRESKLCAENYKNFVSDSDYYDDIITPIKMGCCEKQKACFLKNEQGDCARWVDEPEAFCLACNSCKVVILSNLRGNWAYLANANLYAISFLIVTYFFGCFARKDIHQESKTTMAHQLSNTKSANVVS